MPDMWLVNLMEHEIRERDGIDDVVFLPTIKGTMFQRFELVW